MECQAPVFVSLTRNQDNATAADTETTHHADGERREGGPVRAEAAGTACPVSDRSRRKRRTRDGDIEALGQL